MDPSASAENDIMEDGKYYDAILQNTLHKELLGILDKIDPQRKHTFLDIILHDLNSVLSCFKCKLPLKKNSASFNCGHKYCEQCIRNLQKCTSCYDGIIISDIRDFSNILNVINEIKSNFNSDKVIYEMMRYLLMPQKFPYIEEVAETMETNVECTPSDSSATDNVAARKSRKSTLTARKSSGSSSALKNSRKKLEFNKESKESKSSKNTSNLDNDSDCLFLGMTKNKQKVAEKKRSYLELQPAISDVNNTSSPGSNTRSKRKSSAELQLAISESNKISSPGSNTRSKRKSNESCLELQPTIAEISNVTTPVPDAKRKRKTSDTGSVDQNVRKSKRLKTKNNSEDSSIDDEKSEPRSSRRKTSRQKTESPQRSSDSPIKGEEKQPNVMLTKVNPSLNSFKIAVDDVKKQFAPGRDIDGELLDPDIWERNDKYEKRKNLFKAVKERHNRDISIGGSLKNLLGHRKPSPKKQSPAKSDCKAEKVDIKNDPETNTSENEKEAKKKSTRITPTKERISRSRQLSKDLASKFVNTSNPEQKEPTGMVLRKISPKKVTNEKELFGMPLRKTTPKKKSPIKTNDSTVESAKKKNNLQVRLPIIKMNPGDKSYTIYSPQKNISETEKIIELEQEAPKAVDKIDQVGKESAKISSEVSSSIVEDSCLVDMAKEKAPVEEPILAKEPPVVPREILAEITDQQQNAMEFGNPTEKPTTPVSAMKFKTPGKLGQPLFPETNGDIFSQKGEVCSSTPCVVTIKKVTKTYSKAKNNLFNKSVLDVNSIVEEKLVPEVSPIAEENNRFDRFLFPDISPIAEKKLRDDGVTMEDLFDELIRTPVGAKNSSKFSSTESPLKTVAPNTHIVVAEVHEVPTTPTAHLAVEKLEEAPLKVNNVTEPTALMTPPVKNPRLDEIVPMEIDTPNKTVSPSKNPRLDEIIPMEVDNTMETVEKVVENLLPKEKELSIELEDEIQPVDSDVERETKLEKVKKLQESINNKTEKTLSSLKKNFNKNTSRLSVEKIKISPSSTTPARKISHFVPIKSDLDKPELNAITTPLSKELPSDDDDTPTQIRGTPTKSIACQTTPDLHLALLKQEFPHLFEKFTSDSAKKDFPLSVYDTPTEMINEGVKITAKTPDVGLLNTTAKFTMVSSVTSSEKKRADEQFMNESVLGDSSFVASANKTANISGYAPLSPQTQGKKKLSCRLNFDNDGEVPEEKILDPPEIIANFDNDDEVLEERILEPPEIIASLDEDVATNAPDLSTNRSKEIDFDDEEFEDKEDEVIASASILENSNLKIFPAMVNQSKVEEDTNKTFFESDGPSTPVSSAVKAPKEDKDSSLTVIPDTVPDTENCIPENDDKKEVFTDEDDDDVDFIAGTPTSQPRRILADTLEKIRTPLALLKNPLDVTLTEFSIVGNTTPDMNAVQPLPDVSQYSEVKKPTSAEITPVTIVEPAANKKDLEKVSLELFNSSNSFLSSASEKILIATSGLKEHETKIIRTFCETFSATYEDKLTDKSTHLVVKTNHKNRTARTFKYLQAIVSQVRIVSMKWIQECLAHEKIVNEEKYIPLDSSGECGPLRTYHVIKNITPSPLSWLNEYCIYFTEPVPQECTLQQLQSIMQKAGAVVINNMREFKNYPKHHHIIIVSDDDDFDDEYNMKIAGWLETYEAVSVEFNWILEVIGRNRLMPFADFEVIEIPNEYLLQRNFPPVMLQSNEEDMSSD